MKLFLYEFPAAVQDGKKLPGHHFVLLHQEALTPALFTFISQYHPLLSNKTSHELRHPSPRFFGTFSFVRPHTVRAYAVAMRWRLELRFKNFTSEPDFSLMVRLMTSKKTVLCIWRPSNTSGLLRSCFHEAASTDRYRKHVDVRVVSFSPVFQYLLINRDLEPTR